MKKFALFFSLLLLIPASAAADLNQAISDYRQGRYSQARPELERLAEQGDPDAQALLGHMYANGQGVLQDYVEAHKWFNLAAAQGSSGAREARDRIEKRMTPQQLAQAQQLAREWQPKPAETPAQTTASAPLAREEIKQIQEGLSRLGYYSGSKDGLMGPNSRSAIEKYQKAAGLPVTGEPSRSLLAQLTPGSSPAEGTNASPPPSAPQPGSEDRMATLVNRLQNLADEIKKKNAASDWVLDRLRTMIREYSWPWEAKLIDDDFQDGDYTHDPSWTVDSGQFSVQSGFGLVSSQALPSSSGAQETSPSNRDLPMSILGAILNQAAGSGGSGTGTAAKAAQAEIHLAKPIPNAFAVRLTLQSAESRGSLELGLYQGPNRDSGYRVALLPGGRPGVELMRIRNARSAVVETYPNPTGISDGKEHLLEWTRDGTGTMQVAMDGKVLFQISDRGISGAFDGIALINRGGEYRIRQVAVYGESGSS